MMKLGLVSAILPDESFEALYRLNQELQEQKKAIMKERAPGARDVVRLSDTIQLLTEVAREEGFVHVAERGDLDVRLHHEQVQQLRSAVAHADEPHAKLLVRPRGNRPRHRRQARRHQ